MLGQWAGLRGGGLRAVHLRLVLRLHDRRLPLVLGLLALGVLFGLGGHLIGIRLGDGGGLLDGCVVWRRHGHDVAEPAVVDRLDLQRVDGQADLGHLALGAVQHFGGKLLPFGDDLLDCHRADDGSQVAGEDPAGQDRHLVLVGQEPLPGSDDRLDIAADLECDDRLDVQCDALLGHAGLLDLGLGHRQG